MCMTSRICCRVPKFPTPCSVHACPLLLKSSLSVSELSPQFLRISTRSPSLGRSSRPAVSRRPCRQPSRRWFIHVPSSNGLQTGHRPSKGLDPVQSENLIERHTVASPPEEPRRHPRRKAVDIGSAPPLPQIVNPYRPRF